MFDSEGYPTDETLRKLREWPYQDAGGALDFMRSAWHWPEYVREDLSPGERLTVHAGDGDRFLRCATGGWSGNESLIEALKHNTMVWMFTWKLSAAGGLYIFSVRRIIGGAEIKEAERVPLPPKRLKNCRVIVRWVSKSGTCLSE